MQFIQMILDFLHGPNAGVYFAALFAVSEGLALIPAIGANSVFQAILNVLKFIKDKIIAPPPVA